MDSHLCLALRHRSGGHEERGFELHARNRLALALGWGGDQIGRKRLLRLPEGDSGVWRGSIGMAITGLEPVTLGL